MVLLTAALLLTSACADKGSGKADDSASESLVEEFSPAPESSNREEASEESLVSDGSSHEKAEEDTVLNYHSKTYWLKDTEGTYEDAVVKNEALTLADGKTKGSFTVELDVGSFDTMMASWNANTSGGGRVSLSVAFETDSGEWSDFLSWGVWSSKSGTSASASPECPQGKIGIDILTVNEGYTATGKIKVKLDIKKGTKSPKIYNFSICTPQMNKAQTVAVESLPESHLNEVPMRSQLAAENGADGNRICSPTTVVMALEYMGTKLKTMTAAKAIYDNGWKAYGNWSFACAYAGEKGYTAYVDLYDRDMMKYALSQGYVIGCSTYLTSSGHLVLLSGYTVIDGVEYYISNDPNVNENDIKLSYYTVEYFEQRWLRDNMNGLGVVYVFQNK